MPRSRRFALIAALVLAAGVGLAGCSRSQPATAAYVGGTRYTERQIDTIVADIRRSSAAQQFGVPRRMAVGWLVLGDLARRAAKAQSIAVPPSDYDGLARQLNLPPDARLVHVIADWFAAGNAIAQRATPVQPTEDDLRVMYNALRADPQFPPDETFEQAAQELRDNPTLPIVISVRNTLRDEAKKHSVVVNPRYRPLITDLGEDQRPVPLVLAEGSDVVLDLPEPAGTDS